MFRRLTASFAAARRCSRAALDVRARADAHHRRTRRRSPGRALHARRAPVPARPSGGSVRDVRVAGGPAGGPRPRRRGAPPHRAGRARSPTRTTSSSPTRRDPGRPRRARHAVGRRPLRRVRPSAPRRSTPPACSACSSPTTARRARSASAATTRCSPTASRTPATSSSSTTGSSSSTGTPRSCAAPERDLWHLDPGDGSILDAYRRAHRRHAVTGRPRPVPPLVGPHRDRRLPRRAPAPAHRHDRHRRVVEGPAAVPAIPPSAGPGSPAEVTGTLEPCRSSGRFVWRPCRPPR